jgi:hypothetical protein
MTLAHALALANPSRIHRLLHAFDRYLRRACPQLHACHVCSLEPQHGTV